MSPALRNRILYRSILGNNLTGFRNYADQLMYRKGHNISEKIRISPQLESTILPNFALDLNEPSCIEEFDDTTRINLGATHANVTVVSQLTDNSEYAHNYSSYMSTVNLGLLDQGIENYHSGILRNYQFCGKCHYVCGRLHDSILLVQGSNSEIIESMMADISSIDALAVPPEMIFNGHPVFSQTGNF